jgi:hypothetical protein
LGELSAKLTEGVNGGSVDTGIRKGAGPLRHRALEFCRFGKS